MRIARLLTTLLVVAAVGSLASRSQAIVLNVTINTSNEWFVSSTNSHVGSTLDVLQRPALNSISLVPTESNLALGTMATNFFAPAFEVPQIGTYTFGTQPANFDVVITDLANALNTVTIPVVGQITGTVNVTSTAPPVSNGNLTYKILTVGGVTVPSTFDDNGIPSLSYAFNFFGEPLLIKIRNIQSPPLFNGTDTAIEGRIKSVPTVPEPGSLALLIGSGVTGSAFLIRRRR